MKFKSFAISAAFFLTLSAALSASTPMRALLKGSAMNRWVFALPKDPNDLKAQLQFIHRGGFDLAGVNLLKGEAEVIVTDDAIRYLESNGFTGHAIERHAPGMKILNSIDSRFYTPDKVEKKLKELNQAYPSLTRLEPIGKSIEGRTIWSMVISTTPAKGDARALEKPSVIFDGMHHAREVMTPEIPIDIAESLLSGYTSGDAEAHQWVDHWQIWVVPMLNVDGNSIVWSGDNWWRKNAHADGGEKYGVDINRNYPYKWGVCNGSSTEKYADDFRGDSGGSEPETQALVGLAEQVRPSASISYHSYSELVLYPYGCSGEFTDENKLISTIGDEMAKLLPSDSSASSHYSPGTPWQLLYSVDGDSMSFMFGQFGAIAYVFEINQEFQPSYDLRTPTVEKHRKAWRHFMSRIDQSVLKVSVIDAKTGKPARATVSFDSVKQSHGERPFQTNSAGNFFKVLLDGDYRVMATLADGRKAEATARVNGKTAANIIIQVP